MLTHLLFAILVCLMPLQYDLPTIEVTADDTVIDKSCRIVIPAAMKKAVGIDKDVIFLGARRRIELWSPAKWKECEKLQLPDYEQRLGMLVDDVFGY